MSARFYPVKLVLEWFAAGLRTGSRTDWQSVLQQVWSNHLQTALVASLAAVGLLGMAAPVGAQQGKIKVPFHGTQIFSNQLHVRGLEPLHQVGDLANVNATDTLIIVFGKLEVLDEIKQVTGGLAKFQEDGGALLIASDRNDHGRLKDLNLKIGDRYWLECGPESPQYAYRNDRKFLFVPKRDDLHHPLFLGMKKGLATNHPSNLTQLEGCNFHALWEYPAAWYQTPNGVSFFQQELPFIVGTASTSGPNERVVIIPGHGLFMNGLMAQHDNDNAAFSQNCIRWLTDMGRRKKVLLVVENQVVTKLNLPLGTPPVPPVHLINALLRAIEEENLFNKLLLGIFPGGGGALLRWELGIGSVLLLVFALGSLVRGRLASALGSLLRRRVSALQLAPPPIVQRRQAILRQGNLWEAAHILARQCFEGAALRRPPGPPRAVRGPAGVRRSLDDQVRRLWQLAYGPAARPILAEEFALLLQSLDRVRSALADGMLLFPDVLPPVANAAARLAAEPARP